MLQEIPWGIWLAIGLCFSLIFYIIMYKIHQLLKLSLKPFKKGNSYWCRVIKVSDGDTVTCRRFNLRASETKLRLAYIDAPESGQKFGKESQDILKKLVEKKFSRIYIQNTDRYSRHVGEIHCRGKNVNEEMLKLGAAWVYEDYVKDINYLKHLNQLQSNAKKKKKGLWQQTRPVRPSDHRKQNVA